MRAAHGDDDYDVVPRANRVEELAIRDYLIYGTHDGHEYGL